MIIGSLEYIAHTPVAQAVVPVLVSGVKYSVDGAVAGVAVAILGSLAFGYIASRKDPSAAGAVPFMILGGSVLGAKWGAIAGATFGIGKAVLFGR